MSNILIRFNTKHAGHYDLWRVIVDGLEYQVADLDIDVPVRTARTFEAAETKWNIFCRGQLKVKDGIAYIRA